MFYITGKEGAGSHTEVIRLSDTADQSQLRNECIQVLLHYGVIDEASCVSDIRRDFQMLRDMRRFTKGAIATLFSTIMRALALLLIMLLGLGIHSYIAEV